jgi:hypothetical protein
VPCSAERTLTSAERSLLATCGVESPGRMRPGHICHTRPRASRLATPSPRLRRLRARGIAGTQLSATRGSFAERCAAEAGGSRAHCSVLKRCWRRGGRTCDSLAESCDVSGSRSLWQRTKSVRHSCKPTERSRRSKQSSRSTAKGPGQALLAEGYGHNFPSTEARLYTGRCRAFKPRPFSSARSHRAPECNATNRGLADACELALRRKRCFASGAGGLLG